MISAQLSQLNLLSDQWAVLQQAVNGVEDVPGHIMPALKAGDAEDSMTASNLKPSILASQISCQTSFNL